MPDRWTGHVNRTRDQQLLSMPPTGGERVSLPVKWICPYCQQGMTVTALWPHLDEVHGVYWNEHPRNGKRSLPGRWEWRQTGS